MIHCSRVESFSQSCCRQFICPLQPLFSSLLPPMQQMNYLGTYSSKETLANDIMGLSVWTLEVFFTIIMGVGTFWHRCQIISPEHLEFSLWFLEFWKLTFWKVTFSIWKLEFSEFHLLVHWTILEHFEFHLGDSIWEFQILPWQEFSEFLKAVPYDMHANQVARLRATDLIGQLG